jgi:hypothetical protein
MRDRPRLWLAHWLSCALLLAGATPAPAQADVDLLLVLAVDASGSVDAIRFDLQKRGYMAAFRHARVLQAIRSGANQAIAATMVQWTGPTLQVQVVGWSRIGEEQTATAFAAAIEAAPRRLFGGGTSISGAIDYGSTLLAMSPFRAHRRIIDVSGDGSNNRGRPASLARDEAVAAGMGINGLPILALEPDLDRYYYDNVIGGPGAFVVAAQSYDTFADAILKKLITEIAARERWPDMARFHGSCRGPGCEQNNGTLVSRNCCLSDRRRARREAGRDGGCDGSGHHQVPIDPPLYVHGLAHARLVNGLGQLWQGNGSGTDICALFLH